MYIAKGAQERLGRGFTESIYPIYTDIYEFSVHTLEFVQNYIETYYGATWKEQDEAIHSDAQLVASYAEVTKNLEIGPKFKLETDNIVQILASIMTNGSLWDNHLGGSVSFEVIQD